jgi:hypothetical protein
MATWFLLVWMGSLYSGYVQFPMETKQDCLNALLNNKAASIYQRPTFCFNTYTGERVHQ